MSGRCSTRQTRRHRRSPIRRHHYRGPRPRLQPPPRPPPGSPSWSTHRGHHRPCPESQSPRRRETRDCSTSWGIRAIGVASLVTGASTSRQRREKTLCERLQPRALRVEGQANDMAGWWRVWLVADRLAEWPGSDVAGSEQAFGFVGRSVVAVVVIRHSPPPPAFVLRAPGCPFFFFSPSHTLSVSSLFLFSLTFIA